MQVCRLGQVGWFSEVIFGVVAVGGWVGEYSSRGVDMDMWGVLCVALHGIGVMVTDVQRGVISGDIAACVFVLREGEVCSRVVQWLAGRTTLAVR